MAEPLRIELKPKKAQKAAGLIGHEGPVTGEVLYGGKDPLGQSQTVVNITGQYKGASVTYSLGIVEDRHDPAHPQYQFNIAIRNGNQRAAYKINDMARNVQREQREASVSFNTPQGGQTLGYVPSQQELVEEVFRAVGAGPPGPGL